VLHLVAKANLDEANMLVKIDQLAIDEMIYNKVRFRFARSDS